MKLPVSRILKRLRIEKYAHMEFSEISQDFMPEKLYIDTAKHIGAPSVPVVKAGDKIKRGQKIADFPEDTKLSSYYHSPVNGRVESVDNGKIVIITEE